MAATTQPQPPQPKQRAPQSRPVVRQRRDNSAFWRYLPIRIFQVIVLLFSLGTIVDGLLSLSFATMLAGVFAIFALGVADILIDIELNTRKLR